MYSWKSEKSLSYPECSEEGASISWIPNYSKISLVVDSYSILRTMTCKMDCATELLQSSFPQGAYNLAGEVESKCAPRKLIETNTSQY